MIDAAALEKDRRPAWQEADSIAVKVIKVVIFAIIALCIIYPFLNILSTSLANEADVVKNGGLVIWPEHPTLAAYQTILSGGVVTRAIIVSIGVTTVGTLLSLAVTIGMAYGLSRPIIGGKWILLIALMTLFFVPGIIANYLVVKQLGLLNTYASLILGSGVMLTAFNLVVMRQFFMGIPSELMDSARIDGANDFTILTKIVLPLSKAVIAVIALFYAVQYWNNFFNALLYLNDNSMWPLQLVLRLYVVQGAPLPGANVDMTGAGAPPPAQSIQMAVVVIAMLPILCLYPFLQRYFTSGVLSGAVKG
jgi:putative aldouronate transport system permease protein